MIDPSEQNRNKRRDKKFDRKRAGMRVSMAGRKLAEILLNLRRNDQASTNKETDEQVR